MVEITLDTVKLHNKPTDLWVVIENKVYDLTKFRNEVSIHTYICTYILFNRIYFQLIQHPGGEDTLDEVAGRDATKDFIDVGHSQEARYVHT